MNNITMKMNADELILQALREDITSEDITTNSVMPHYQAGEVDLICKQDGVIAGLEVFKRVFELLDEKTEVVFNCKDGDTVRKGEKIGMVRGDIRVLLSGERTALNFLQRMSGIATYTREIADLLKGSKTKLLDTRKTTPNMRIFEKYSVKVGGGYNHRYNLSDGVLLKDNHIGAAGSVKNAVKMAKEYASKKASYAPKSSSMKTLYHSSPKRPAERQESSESKARSMSFRTATSCTSSSTSSSIRRQ